MEIMVVIPQGKSKLQHSNTCSWFIWSTHFLIFGMFGVVNHKQTANKNDKIFTHSEGLLFNHLIKLVEHGEESAVQWSKLVN